MSQHEKFSFKTIDDLRAKTYQLNLNINYSDDIKILSKPVKVGKLTAANALQFFLWKDVIQILTDLRHRLSMIDISNMQRTIRTYLV